MVDSVRIGNDSQPLNDEVPLGLAPEDFDELTPAELFALDDELQQEQFSTETEADSINIFSSIDTLRGSDENDILIINTNSGPAANGRYLEARGDDGEDLLVGGHLYERLFGGDPKIIV